MRMSNLQDWWERRKKGVAVLATGTAVYMTLIYQRPD